MRVAISLSLVCCVYIADMAGSVLLCKAALANNLLIN